MAFELKILRQRNQSGGGVKSEWNQRKRRDSRRRKDKVDEAKTIRREMAEWKRTMKRKPKTDGSVGSRERKGRERGGGGGREKKCKQSLGI